jgi:hypothetical protein
MVVFLILGVLLQDRQLGHAYDIDCDLRDKGLEGTPGLAAGFGMWSAASSFKNPDWGHDPEPFRLFLLLDACVP